MEKTIYNGHEIAAVSRSVISIDGKNYRLALDDRGKKGFVFCPMRGFIRTIHLADQLVAVIDDCKNSNDEIVTSFFDEAIDFVLKFTKPLTVANTGRALYGMKQQELDRLIQKSKKSVRKKT